MADVTIDKLFDTTRFPDGLSLLPVILYFPLGLVVVLLRIFIGLHALLVFRLLPKALPIRGYILRVMYSVLGLVVLCDGMEDNKDHRKLLVANHISALDHCALDVVVPNLLTNFFGIANLLQWIHGFKQLGSKSNKDELVKNIKSCFSDYKIPLFIQPEGASTSGKVGLLKFGTTPFSLGYPIQPISISVTRPTLLSISTIRFTFRKYFESTVTSPWWSDLFWSLFVPYTIYTIRILPLMTQTENETEDDLAERVRSVIAKDLKITTTDHTYADKQEYSKRIIAEQSLSNNKYADGKPTPFPVTAAMMGTVLPGIEHMAQQVSEVLPDMSITAIRRDLAITRDVDVTITNMLEHPENYTEKTEVKTPYLSSSATLISGDKIIFSASTFGKNQNERTMSFQERKKAMIETARRCYIEKYGLN